MERASAQNFIHTYPPFANGDRVKVGQNNSSSICDFYLEKRDTSLMKIRDVVTPVDFAKIPSSSRKDVLNTTYPLISVLSDDAIKLRINFQVLGGTQDLVALIKSRPYIQDNELAKLVIQNLPIATYSVVQVNSIKYSFCGTPETPTRVISLVPDYGNDFAKFIQKLKTFLVGVRYTQSGTYNGNAICKYVLGIEQDAEAEAALKQAFQQKRGMRIYLANDGERMYLELDRNQSGLCIIS